MEQKMKKTRVSFTFKLLFMFLAVLLVANITLGTVAYRIASGGMRQSVYREIDTISDNVVNQIVDINEKQFTVLRFLSNLMFLRDESISLQEKNRQLSLIAPSLGGYYENVAFYDMSGKSITADGRLLDFSSREYFKVPAQGKDFMSDPAFSTVTGTVLQHYGVPVYSTQNQIIGVLVLVITGNTMADVIKTIDMGGGISPSIVNYRTRVPVASAHDDADESLKEISSVLPHILGGSEGIDDFVSPSTKERMLVSYKHIPGTDWTVFGVMPYGYYFGSLSAMQTFLAAVILITIAVSSLLNILFISVLIKPLKNVKKSITTIASGNADLTQRIEESSNDEIGDVVRGFNAFVEKLQNIVTNLQNSKGGLQTVDSELQASTKDAEDSIAQIISNIEGVNGQILSQADSVTETAAAVGKISANIESLEKLIESQSASVSQASSAVEQMIGNINSVNSSVGKMISSFTHLTDNSNSGTVTQNKANEKIMLIEEQSKMLQDANIAIASIAEQTNLLAMNAAIEAAHAGEAGKGFAVVADEIRKLSETSSEQSKTIGDELQKIHETIQEVVAVSNETNIAFSAISQSIDETSHIIGQIKTAMEEQQAGSRQITDALQSMNSSTSKVKSASLEMTEDNRQILLEIQNLQQATDTIKGSIRKMQSGAQHINETGAALSKISGKVGENIRQIGGEIDLFKV